MCYTVTAAHPIVSGYVGDAIANSQRHRAEVLAKIADILRRGGIAASDVDAKATEIYEAKKSELAGLMHVSVNTIARRVIAMLHSGYLPPTEQRDIYSKLHRDNAQQCFADPVPESPIYGALNLASPRGGAPVFSSDIWVKLLCADISDRTTFTARDSYNITKPYLAEFDVAKAHELLRSEVFTWDTVLDYVLNRFWDVQELKDASYVEAQVWGGVSTANVESIHVRSSLNPTFLSELERCVSTDVLSRIKSMICLFD